MILVIVSIFCSTRYWSNKRNARFFVNEPLAQRSLVPKKIGHLAGQNASGTDCCLDSYNLLSVAKGDLAQVLERDLGVNGG